MAIIQPGTHFIHDAEDPSSSSLLFCPGSFIKLPLDILPPLRTLSFVSSFRKTESSPYEDESLLLSSSSSVSSSLSSLLLLLLLSSSSSLSSDDASSSSSSSIVKLSPSMPLFLLIVLGFCC